MKRTDYAYIAGIMDGEGSIGIYRNKSRRAKTYGYYPKVAVANTNEWLIQWLRFSFGGAIGRNKPKSENQKVGLSWIISRKPAINFLKLIRPYLRLKQAQADLVIQFYDQLPRRVFRWAPKTSEEREIDATFKQLMATMNKKGPTDENEQPSVAHMQQLEALQQRKMQLQPRLKL